MPTFDSTAPVLALDIGNVCVRLYPDECARRLGYDTVEQFLAEHPNVHVPWAKMETGLLADDSFFTYLGSLARPPIDATQAAEAWCSLIGEETPGLDRLIDEALERGITPVFMSDISVTHFNYTLERLSFADKITDSVLSYEVGVRKPHPSIYEAMERQYCDNRRPLLYVDDKPENIAAGRERGWECYQFGSIQGLRAKLMELVGNEK